MVKRVRIRLTGLKNNMKKIKLDDAKGLSWKGRLIDAEINKLQVYYGHKKNVIDVKAMKIAIWPIPLLMNIYSTTFAHLDPVMV